MEFPLYQVDAFTDRLFAGNPAAVCVLPRFPDDELLLAIAAENNLSETAFLVGGAGRYRLRWFTPRVEVPLCGHATLAAALVVTTRLEPGRERVDFDTASGPLGVEREGDRLVVDLPARPARPAEPPPALLAALGAQPRETHTAERTWLCLLADEQAVRAVEPDFAALAAFDRPYVIVTAPGREVDFVSRFFAPGVGVPEDPVTGAAHCVLAPFWSERLGRATLSARQVSRRGGELGCEVRGDRVRLGGRAVLYLEGRARCP